MSAANDKLLDAYGRLLRALMVLHHEAPGELDFDAWVELAEVRYAGLVTSFDKDETQLPDRICPEKDCIGAYARVGDPYVGGRDHTGAMVVFQRWECNGRPRHWHTTEVRP